MKNKILVFCFLLLMAGTATAQILQPFVNRYNVTQRGGLVIIGNNMLTCNGGAGCTSAKGEVAPAGSSDDNDFSSAYVDIDGVGATFSSSSADLDLPTCSKVSFAGLYWGAYVNTADAKYGQRGQIKIKQPGAGAYTTLTADELNDFNSGYDYYTCYKDITSIVTAADSGTFTMADLLAATGGSNQWAGWAIVIVYKNQSLTEKNLTVFDGLGYVSNGGNSVTVTASGFYTPPAGAVNFELGEIAYDGDRGLNGDSLKFNGAGSFVAVSDALHDPDNIFNSTIANNGVEITARNPSYHNTLGFDANIFVPNNAAKNYLSNGATTAQLKVTTGGEQIYLQVLTSAIDTYEPDLHVQKVVTDVNGGLAELGDTLLYTVTSFNNGNDTSIATIVADTIPFNADYVPNSMAITAGYNSGAKTDASGDDQAEYIGGATPMVKFRLGTGATSASGGKLPNAGGNSTTTFTFKVRITDDCTKLACNPTISNRAAINFTGKISGLSRSALSNPLKYDAKGCLVDGFTSTDVNVPVGCVVPPDTSVGGCLPLVFSTVPGIRPNYTYYNSSWTSVTQANTTGTYHGIRQITGTSCADTINFTVYVPVPTTANAGTDQAMCNVTSATMAGNTAAVGTGTWTRVSGPNTPTFTSPNSPTTTVTGMVAGVYILRWTISIGACASTQDDVQITIYALPTTSNAGADQNLCNVASATLAGNTPGTGTGAWTLVSGPNTPTITTPSSATSTVTGMIAGVYTLRWTITNGTCTSSTDDVQITIYALPTTSNAGADQNLCNVTSTTITGNSPTTGTGTWTMVSGPNTPTITAPSSASTTVTGMIAGVYTFRWAITNGVCATSNDDVQVTIYALPTTSNAGPDQDLCNVNSVTLAGNAAATGSGTWTRISGPNTPTITTPSSPTSTITGMIAGVYIYRWTITNGVCASSTDDVQITIYALPTVSNAGADQNLCNVTSATLAGNAAAVGGGTWSLISGPNTPTITTPSSQTSTVTGMIAGVYILRWTISNGVCASSSDDVQITIYDLPTVSNAGPDQNLCNVTSATLAGNTPSTGSGNWTLVGGPNTPTITTPGSPNTSISGMIAGVYTFRWTISNGVCASSTDDVVITIYALPTVSNAGPDQNLCNVTTTTFAGNTAVVGSGAWSLISGPNTPTVTTPSSPVSTITGMIAGVYTYRWSITNGVCAVSTDDVVITIYAIPTTSNAGPDQNLCNVTSTTFAGNTPVVGNGNWTLISGPNSPTITTSSSPTSTITGMVSGVYTFRWTISNGVCATSADDVVITIYATPTTANAGPAQNLCNVSSASLAGNTPVAGSGNWSLISGPNAPTITAPGSANTTVTGMIAGVYTFRWTISNGVCAASTDDVVITIYATPTTANAGPAQNLCNVTGTTLAGNTPAIGSGTWTLISGPNAPTITTPSSPASTITGMITGVYTFRWTVSNGVCATSTDDVVITIYALPTVSNAGPDQNLCNVNSSTLAANAPVTGTGLWTLISGPNTPTITTPTNPTSTITGMVTGVYTLRWSITNGVCASSTDDIQITIYAIPTVSNAGPDQNLCNVSSVTLAGNNPAIGSGNWSLISGPNAPTITASGTPNTSITGMIAGVYVFRWTITNGVCATSSDDVQITIYALSTVSNAGADQPLCNVTSTTLTGNTPVNGTGTWTLISGPNLPTITTPSSPTSTVTGMTFGTYTLRWTITNGVCSSSTDDAQITVYAIPTVANAGPDQSLCNVTTTSFAGNTPVIGTGVWTLISGPNTPTITTPSSPSSSITSMVPGVYTFRWTVTNGVCTPSTDDVDITIFALPTVSNAGPDQNLCNVTSTTLAGNSAISGSGTWSFSSGPNVPTITSSTNPSSTVTGMIPGTYTFRWTINSGVCSVSFDDVQVTIYDLPTVSVAGPDQNVCNVTSVTLGGNTPVIGTGAWSLLGGPNTPTITTVSNPSTSVSGMIPGVYTFRWTISNGVCAVAFSDVQITIFNLPSVVDAGPDQSLCNIDSTVMAGNVPGFGTGTWTLISGPNVPAFADSTDPSSSVTGMIFGTYQFGWTISNGVCVSFTDTVEIIVFDVPTVSSAGPDQDVCSVTSVTLSANTPTVGTGLWTFVSGPNSPTIDYPDSATTTVSSMIPGVYLFDWSITSGVCSVSHDTIQVTIYNTPLSIDAGPDQNLCNIDSAVMAGNAPSAGVGTWTFISGPNTPVITSPTDSATSVTGMIAGVYVFGWTINNGACTTPTDLVNITIYDLPTVADAGIDQNLCHVDSTSMTANAASTGAGNWTLLSGPNTLAIADTTLETTPVTGMIPGTYVFVWTISNGVCSSTSDTIQITIYDLPTVSLAGPDQSLCNIDSTVMAGNIALIGSGNWSLVSGSNVPVIIDSTNASTSITGMIPGIYSFAWTINNGVCAISSDTMQVVIYALPTVSDAGPDQNLCNVYNTTLAGNAPSGESAVWTLISGPNVPVIAVPSDPASPVSGLVAGVYQFTWTITNGVCPSSIDTVQLNVYDLPTVANASSDQFLCADTIITLTGNGATTGTGLWTLNSGPNIPTITVPSDSVTTVTGIIPGTYVFNWAISNGSCAVSNDSVQFTIYQYPPVIDAGPDQVLCNVSDISLTGNNPASGNGTWSLLSGPNVPAISSPNSPSTSVSGMIAGIYSFGWSIANGVCAVYTDTVQVTIYDLPTVADAGPDQSLCNTTSINLAGNNITTGSGLWSFTSGPNTPVITSSTSATSSVTGMIQGTYLFSWTTSNGVCSSTTDTVSISIFNIPLSVDAGPDQHLCNTDSAVMAGNSPSSGTGTWTLVSGPVVPVITTPTDSATSITGMAAGTYVFGWTVNNGVCSTPTDMVTISIDDLPTVADAGSDQVLCNDTLIILSGNVPSTGSGVWTLVSGPNVPLIESPNSPSTDVENLAPGVYTFLWTISNGVCSSSSDSIQVTIYDLPTVANAGPDLSICNSDSIILAGNAASTGSGTWTYISGPNVPVITDSSNAATSVTSMIAGTYFFAWTVANGICAATSDTMMAVLYDLPTVADAGPDQQLCNGGTATMAGSNPVTGTGTWSLVSGPNVPVITSSGNPNTTVTGMVQGDYLFSWVISNGSCSSSSDTVFIHMEDILPVADAGPDQDLCNSTFTLITTTLAAAVPSSGTGTWTLMSGPNVPFIFSPNSPSTLVSGLAQGTYVFRWTITNGVCTATFDDVSISVYNVIPAIADAGPDQDLCRADSTYMNGEIAQAGSGTWTFISGPNIPVIQSPTSATSLISGMIPGVYYFGWTYSNGPCSSTTDSMKITIYDLPTIADAGPDQEYCRDSSATLAGNIPVTGNGTWSQVNGPSLAAITNPNTYNSTVTALITGVYTFRWTISNGACDSSADDMQITIYNVPLQTNAGPDQLLCGDTSALLAGAQPAYGNGNWSLVSGPTAPSFACAACPSTIINGLTTGVYNFSWTVTNGVCATVSDTVQLTLIDHPTVPAAGPDQVICNKDSALLSGNIVSIGTGLWTVVSGPSTPLIAYPDSASTLITQLQFGTYVFRWTISSGNCTQYDDVNITVAPPLIISTNGPVLTFCTEMQVALVAGGANTYSWSPADHLSNPSVSNPIASPYHTTTYTVTGTDLNGCTGTATIAVVVCDTIIIPDGVTPDGDGVNDHFVIVGIENYPGNKVQIFNRWGNLIYEKKSYDNSWDGVPNVGGVQIGTGKVPPGTYYYVVDLGTGENSRAGFLVIKY